MKTIKIFAATACILVSALFCGCYNYNFPPSDNLIQLNVISFDLQYPKNLDISVNPTAESQEKRFEMGQKLVVDMIDYKAPYIFNGAGEWVPEEHPVVFVEGRTYSLKMVFSYNGETDEETEDKISEFERRQDGTKGKLIISDSYKYNIYDTAPAYGILDITGFKHNNALFEIRLSAAFKTSAQERIEVKAGQSIAYNIPKGYYNWYQVIVKPRTTDMVLNIGGNILTVPVSDVPEGIFKAGYRYVIKITKEDDELKIISVSEENWLNLQGYVSPEDEV